MSAIKTKRVNIDSKGGGMKRLEAPFEGERDLSSSKGEGKKVNVAQNF